MSRNTADYTSQQVRTANLTESDRHTLLSSEPRRRVLKILEEETTPVPLTDVAAELAKREPDSDAETVKHMEITLHHTHLPKMDELGVLTYDPNSHQISW